MIIFGGATLVALITWESHIKSAVKTAPPKIPFVMLSEAKHLYLSLRASIASVAIERAERSKTLDCFALLALTQKQNIARTRQQTLLAFAIPNM